MSSFYVELETKEASANRFNNKLTFFFLNEQLRSIYSLISRTSVNYVISLISCVFNLQILDKSSKTAFKAV